jgi:hypothetical protein
LCNQVTHQVTKPLWLSNNAKCDTQHCGLGDLNVTNKTNKQTTFLSRQMKPFVNEYTHTWFWDVFVHGYLRTGDVSYLPHNIKAGKQKEKGLSLP